MARLIPTFVTVAVGLAMALLLACSSERGTGTDGNVGSLVYVSIQQDTVVTIIFDAEGDTILDSIRIPEWRGAPHVYADPRAPRLLLAHGGDIRIYAAGETVPENSYRISSFELGFAPSADLIIGSAGGAGCTTPGQITLYHSDNMVPLFTDTIGLSKLQVNEKRGLVFGLAYSCSDRKGLTHSNIGAYDFVERKLHKIWEIDPDSTGTGKFIKRFGMHPDGRHTYGTMNTAQGPILFGFDTRDERVIFRQQVYSTRGHPQVTPDGRELWYPDPGWGSQNPFDAPETITIYDAGDGSLLEVITLDSYKPLGMHPVKPRKIRFDPSGRKAFVVCGGWVAAPFLIIDVQSREVIKSFWHDQERLPREIALGPAPD